MKSLHRNLLIVFGMAASSVGAQTNVTNNGVEITNAQTNIYIKGNYIHHPDASVVNGGTIYITGNIANNSDTSLFITRSGNVVMNGNTTQSITGSSPIHFYHLEVNKPAGELELNQNIQVNKTLALTEGNIFLKDYTIHLDTAGVLMGESETSRVYGENGLITAQRFIDSSRARLAINQAGLGFYVSTNEQFGYVIIERGHKQQAYNGDTSIARYFNFIPVSPTTGLIDTLKIAYLASETVTGEKDYKIYASSDMGTEWRNKGGFVDENNHDVFSTTVSPPEIGKVRFSVFPTENSATCLPNDPDYISAIFLVSSNVYAGDSIHFIQLTSPQPSSYNWNMGDGKLSDDFSPYHIYQLENDEETKYQIAMTVSNGVCSDTRKKYITVSPKPAFKSQQSLFAGFEYIHLFPNPNTGSFNVEFKVNNASEIVIKIMNLQGKLMEERTVQSDITNSEKFDLNKLESGMYYVNLQTKEENRVVKVLKF